LVSRLNNNDVWIWNVEGGKPSELKGLASNEISVITWRDLASTVAIGKAAPKDPLAVIVDQYTILSGPAELLRVWERKARATVGNARAVACSPNGQYLAGVGHRSRVYVYDLESRKQATYEGHGAGLQCIAASPNGKWIATGSDDSTVRIWDRNTEKTVEVIETATFVYSVRFSPDSKLLAIGDNNGQLYLWDVDARTMLKHDVSGRLTDLAFDQKGSYLAVVGWELYLLDLESRQKRASITSGSSQQGKIAISPANGLIVGTANSQAAGEEFKVPNAWSLDGNELFEHKDLFSEKMGHRTFIQAVAFSPDGNLLAATSQGAIRLWDMKQRKPVGNRWAGHTSSINQLMFSLDGKWLASASGDGTARVWEVATARQAYVLDADVYAVSGVDFTPAGEVVTANWDGTAHLWKLPQNGQ
jgi:WD40 repeat protein